MPRRKRNMTYASWQLQKALAMKKKGFSFRQSAEMYGIPVSTLHAWDKSVVSRKKPGKPTVLTTDEEARIVEWVKQIARAGFPIDVERLRTTVGYFIKRSGRRNPFTNGIPGRKWATLFQNRHKDISARVPSSLSKQRTQVTEIQIRRWFREVKTYLKAENMYDLLNNPAVVFNMDETSFHMVPTNEKVLAETTDKYVHTSNANSDRECYTVLFSANAAGTIGPPLVLFPYKQRLPGEIVRKLPDGWAAGKNESGWMTRETFFYYLKNVFYPWLIKNNIPFPVLVFMDGHKSHVSYQTTEFCRENGIVLICLFPNATHLLQPLDVAFFKSLKLHWNKRLVEWRMEQAGEAISRPDVAPLLNNALNDMDNPSACLRSGFRKCGLVPFDANAVEYSMLLENPNSRKQPESVNSSASPSAETIRATHALAAIESFLTTSQIQAFKENETRWLWTGMVGDTNLFYLWRKIRTRASQSTEPDENDDFHGFEESEMDRDHPSVASRRYVPATVTSATTPGTSKTTNADKQIDSFENIFRIPDSSSKRKNRQSTRVHVPVVATSDQFKQYYQRLENERNKENEHRAAKKAEREAKKAEREAKKAARILKKTTKPRHGTDTTEQRHFASRNVNKQ